MRSQLAGILLLALIGPWLLTGCSNAPDPKEEEQAEVALSPEPVEPVETKPDPAELWTAAAEKTQAALAEKNLEAVEAGLQELAGIYEEPEQPSEEQTAQLEQFQQQYDAEVAARKDQRREESLVKADEALSIGELEQATDALNLVLNSQPTDEQRQQANKLQLEIERRRRAKVRLRTAMKMLASDRRSDVIRAQQQLYEEAETAIPLLKEAVRSTEEPHLVDNTLEMFQKLRRPDVAIPEIVGVLQRPEQQASWAAASEQISRLETPGAGPLLLELARNSESPEQKVAVLGALGKANDPPRGAIVELLPLIYSDDPQVTAAALEAAYRSIREHGQFDLLARRGLDVTLTSEDEQRLDQLSTRLQEILDDPTHPAADAARKVAVATRQIERPLLAEVKLLSSSSEDPEWPAAAVLDGQWNSVDPGTMWRYPYKPKGNLVLDLGQECMVVGVRIWNWNEPNGTHRGWKEVSVYVTPEGGRAVRPDAQGLLPPAPGRVDVPDYSTLIPVEFAQGRYVKLQADSVFREDGYAGLAEVQVYGFPITQQPDSAEKTAAAE